MSTPSIQRLHDALADDLKKLGTEGVVNDAVRKTFTARIHGAVIEFGHIQSDQDFWTGVKHYGSGPSSRFRMRRTPRAPVASAKPPVRRKSQKV